MPAEALHPWLSFEPARAVDVVEGFLADYADDAGADGFVVGISGGLDSATAAALAARALGAEALDLVFLPGPTTSEEDREMATAVAEAIGAPLGEVDIAPATAALADELGIDVDRVVRGNLQARLRMAASYARAKQQGSLVLGTGNKSELLTGYFTKHGDGGVDLLPLGDLYKTQVREVAHRIDVPEDVIARPPTAGLWQGQTDEAELGLPYADLDVVLAGIEQQFDTAKIGDAAGVDGEEVERVRALIRASWHKRNPPPLPKLGYRTVGVDWRESTT